MSDRLPYADPGYTPARSEIETCVIDLINASEEQVALIERALGRAGKSAAERACAHLEAAEAGARVRLLRLIGRIVRQSPSPELLQTLCSHLSDADERVQRASIVCLGKLREPGIEEALLDYAAREHAAPEYHALIEALGKVGGSSAAQWLASQSSDDELPRDCSNARA